MGPRVRPAHRRTHRRRGNLILAIERVPAGEFVQEKRAGAEPNQRIIRGLPPVLSPGGEQLRSALQWLQLPIRRWPWVALACALAGAAAQQPSRSPAQDAGATTPASGQIHSAYHERQRVTFTVAPLEAGQKTFFMGPWQFGARLSDRKPRDHRLNLYLVSPGTQHRAGGRDEYDHNDILNALPGKDETAEWDVYWAVVLDPALRRDLRSERELLIAAQSGFRSGDLFELADIPGRSFLREFLKVESLQDLERFRRRDRLFPRLVIVPAGFAIRARATPEESGELPAATAP